MQIGTDRTHVLIVSKEQDTHRLINELDTSWQRRIQVTIIRDSQQPPKPRSTILTEGVIEEPVFKGHNDHVSPPQYLDSNRSRFPHTPDDFGMDSLCDLQSFPQTPRFRRDRRLSQHSLLSLEPFHTVYMPSWHEEGFVSRIDHRLPFPLEIRFDSTF